MISYEKLFTNERKYTSTDEQRELVINKNNIDMESHYISEVVIDDELYFMSTEEKDDTILSINYYDKNGNEVFKEYKDKFIDTYNNYVIVYNIECKLFELYDKEFNFITKFEFENEMINDLVENDEDTYILFSNDNGINVSYIVDCEVEVNYCYYYVVIGGLIALIVAYYFFNKHRK